MPSTWSTGLKYQYGIELARADDARAQVEEVETKLKAKQKTARGKARNTMRMSTVVRGMRSGSR